MCHKCQCRSMALVDFNDLPVLKKKIAKLREARDCSTMNFCARPPRSGRTHVVLFVVVGFLLYKNLNIQVTTGHLYRWTRSVVVYTNTELRNLTTGD